MKKLVLFVFIALMASCSSDDCDTKENLLKKVTFRFTNTYLYKGEFYFNYSVKWYFPNEDVTIIRDKFLSSLPGHTNTYTWDFQDTLYEGCTYQIDVFVRDYEKNPVRGNQIQNRRVPL